jgi:hypothetical protein
MQVDADGVGERARCGRACCVAAAAGRDADIVTGAPAQAQDEDSGREDCQRGG